ncbi:flagellin lysine-N-methylase [Kosakonia sacchari]|uniref:flagellin lysine-N-methylase n=1 Tax=Kosakonia sacchari TaxID=1158459 RepID=UPI0025AFA3EE|nr:flagellin lysine-N-methylase [Kosakonia sacchari]MDN2485369.1 flagellin lysine-N-methylase [Kosakonia sacchari]
MRHHKTVTPVFFDKFKCVGPDCLISCCRSWKISIDKKTHQHYLSSSNPVIAAIAKENLIPVHNGKNEYSVIKLNEDKQCPFVDENRLCMVHRDLGEKALSRTCSTYPRGVRKYADEVRFSMTLSCPEVVRQVLFDPQSMLLQEKTTLVARSKVKLLQQQKPRDQVSQLVHLFTWNLAQAQSNNIEENLMALAQFILYLQMLNFDLQNNLAEVESFYSGLINELQNGRTLLRAQNTSRAASMKVDALTVMGKHVAKYASRDPLISHGHLQIADYLAITPEMGTAELSEKFTALDQQWKQLCQNSCLGEPHVLRNYLLYKLYESDFPGTNIATILRQFYRIVMDYFYLKTFLSVQSLHVEIDQTLVMKTIATFSEKTMHNSTINQRMDAAIDTINGGDDLSCLLLIG